MDRSDPRSGRLETLRGRSTYSRYLLWQGASGARYLALSSGVLIDEAENLLIGLALDVFDLVAIEMHCIHAWWSYAAEEGKGIRIRRIPRLTFHSIAKHHGLTYLSYACMRPPLRCHSIRVLTVIDFTKCGAQKGWGRGVRKGEGSERRGKFVPVHGRAGGYIEVGSYRESELRWLIRPYVP